MRKKIKFEPMKCVLLSIICMAFITVSNGQLLTDPEFVSEIVGQDKWWVNHRPNYERLKRNIGYIREAICRNNINCDWLDQVDSLYKFKFVTHPHIKNKEWVM